MKITVLDDYQNVVRKLKAFEKVKGHDVTVWNDHVEDVEVLAERLKDTEALALIRERSQIRAPLIARLKKLKIISQLGGGRHIDMDACTQHGIVVSFGPGGGGRPSYGTAELTWALIIAALRHLPQEINALKAGKWQAFPMGTLLRGKTLGIYSYGRIGQVVAGYGKAFGMNVLIWGREPSLERARADGYTSARNREEFFRESDIVSIHLLLNNQTENIIKAADFALMKPTSLFVNTSRAGLIEPGSLVTALRAGRPAMAAVDVYEHEPIGPDYPLLSMDNVICTPHLGYAEDTSLENMLSTAFDQIVAFAEGKPITAANPEVLERKPA